MPEPVIEMLKINEKSKRMRGGEIIVTNIKICLVIIGKDDFVGVVSDQG